MLSFFNMKKNVKSNNISNIILCGVVAGYQGEQNTTSPVMAARLVAEALAKLGYPTKVAPAVCVYHTDWGCPIGGEAVGAFTLSEGIALEVAEALRKELKQSTLSVCLPKTGTPTIGFTALIEGSLKEVGARWQAAAAELMNTTGTYVSGGLVDNSDGTCTISAEANPAFVQDKGAWQKVVERICSELGCEPEFKECCFNYLKDAE